MRLFHENEETSLQCCKPTQPALLWKTHAMSMRCHQWSDHPFSAGYTTEAEHFTRCRVHTFQTTVAGFHRLDFVAFMLCELLFIAGAGDRRLKRTFRLHANVTDIRRKRGNRFEPVPMLESMLKVVCDFDECGAERLEDWVVFTSALCYASYTSVSALKCIHLQEKIHGYTEPMTRLRLTCLSSWSWWKAQPQRKHKHRRKRTSLMSTDAAIAFLLGI